jgi:hypothetical protein
MPRSPLFARLPVVLSLVAFAAMAAMIVGLGKPSLAEEKEKARERFFEMRTYIANDGKLDALHARFRDHTNKLFVKHGMELIGYWVPTDEKESKNTLVYILAYPSKEARDKSWKDFVADPAWIKAKDESHKDGVIVKNVISKFMTPTDYSPIK